MKKLVILMAGIITLQACNPSNDKSGESGAINDGIKPIDENGALSDSTKNFDPSLDTAIGDNRVDTEQRDTSKYKLRKDNQ